MICSAVSSLTVSRLHISYSRFPCLSVFFPFRYVYSLFLLYLCVRLSGSLFRLLVSLFLSMCFAFPNLPAYTHLSLEQSLSLSLSLSHTHTHFSLSLSFFLSISLCSLSLLLIVIFSSSFSSIPSTALLFYISPCSCSCSGSCSRRLNIVRPLRSLHF